VSIAAIRHAAAGGDPINCRPQALNRGVHGGVIGKLELPQTLITPYGCRWDNPLNAAAAPGFEPKGRSSGATCPDRSERCLMDAASGPSNFMRLEPRAC